MQKFIKEFTAKFIKDDTATLAASLAFYTVLSLAPMLILFVTISTWINQDLRNRLIDDVRDLAGIEAAATVSDVIQEASQLPRMSPLGGASGMIMLLISASFIFGQLHSTLNRIFGVRVDSAKHERIVALLWKFLRNRFFHMLLALGFIVSIIVSLIVSTSLFSMEGQSHLALILNAAISSAVYVVLFSLLFRYLPDRRMRWRYALEGGAFTAVLFVLGKELISFYLGRSTLGTAYGNAGSIVIFLIWVYYSALITFVGAQVSSLLGRIRP